MRGISGKVLRQWSGPDRDIAFKTCLMLRTVFKMALRHTGGLVDSVRKLMNLSISLPNHTTVSRRAVGLTLLKSPSAPKGRLHISGS